MCAVPPRLPSTCACCDLRLASCMGDCTGCSIPKSMKLQARSGNIEMRTRGFLGPPLSCVSGVYLVAPRPCLRLLQMPSQLSRTVVLPLLAAEVAGRRAAAAHAWSDSPCTM